MPQLLVDLPELRQHTMRGNPPLLMGGRRARRRRDLGAAAMEGAAASSSAGGIGVKGGEKVYRCGVAVQDKCPFKWPA